MDEMQMVKDLRKSTPAITAEAEDLARARLLAALSGPAASRTGRQARLKAPTRKIAWRMAVAGALAAAVAIGFTVAQDTGGRTEPVADAAVVEVLDHATTTAAARPFTAPRADQWVYQHERVVPFPNGTTSQRFPAMDFYRWTRASGTLIYEASPGKPNNPVKVSIPAGLFPPQDYATLSTLPTKPSALLAWLSSHRPAGNTTTDFQNLTEILFAGAGALPPKVEAALFQAMKRLPGVTIRRGLKDLQGHNAIGVVGREDARVGNTPLNAMILLDPETYSYLGTESIFSADEVHTTKEGLTQTIKAGTVDNASVTLQTGIVDEVGQKP